MRFGINNPAFLQAGGNSPSFIRMTTSVEDQAFNNLSASGVVYIDSVKNGEKVRQTLVNPNDASVIVSNDANTEIVVYGRVTLLDVGVDLNSGITSLDVSKSTALTTLECYDCKGLTSLDVSKNAALTTLDCNNTDLTSLDVSKNTALTTLDCGNTDFTSLDVSKNTALTTLDCSYTDLTSLDVSKNTALTELYCNHTSLTSLDVSKNIALEWLNCYDCTGLMLLDIQNTALLENGNLFENIRTNLTTLKVAGTSAWAYEQVENWLNGDAPNDGTILVDENTPQEVIDAATTKGWTVEYVDA